MRPLTRKGRPRRAGRAPQRRWLRPALAAGVGLLLLGGLAGWAVHADWPRRAGEGIAAARDAATRAAGLTVQAVYVTGRTRTDREAIVQALGIREGDPVLSLDLQAARARLLELDWVKDARVLRRLPGIIEIELTEQSPLALWRHGPGLVLVDAEGEPITARALDAFAHLPVLFGEGAADQARAALSGLADKPGLMQRVRGLTLVSGRRWDVLLQGGLVVKLPEHGWRGAWGRLADLQARERLLDRDIEAVDLRQDDRITVRLTPAAAARRLAPETST